MQSKGVYNTLLLSYLGFFVKLGRSFHVPIRSRTPAFESVGALLACPVKRHRRTTVSSTHWITTREKVVLLSTLEDNSEKDIGALTSTSIDATQAALGAATGQQDRNNASSQKDEASSVDPAIPPTSTEESTSAASVALMISQENKRILIEDLGYRRVDVERMRPEVATFVLAKRQRCPAGGMPASWGIEDENSLVRKRLEMESRYPLKVPLLGISLILFGKGFGDLAVTLIKVGTSFPGASLTEEFMGVPIALIDALCVGTGVALGTWTMRTMQSNQ